MFLSRTARMMVKEFILLCLPLCQISGFHSLPHCYPNKKPIQESAVSVWHVHWDPAHSIHPQRSAAPGTCRLKSQEQPLVLNSSAFQSSILASCRKRRSYTPHPSSHTQRSRSLTCWWGACQKWDERDKSTPKSHTSFRNHWFYISCHSGSYRAVTAVSWKHTDTGSLTLGAVRIRYCSSSNPVLEVQARWRPCSWKSYVAFIDLFIYLFIFKLPSNTGWTFPSKAHAFPNHYTFCFPWAPAAAFLPRSQVHTGQKGGRSNLRTYSLLQTHKQLYNY